MARFTEPTAARDDAWGAWLAAMWGAAITYVAAFAALAYAGADASVVGAVASGIASALIAAGVFWAARASTNRLPANL